MSGGIFGRSLPFGVLGLPFRKIRKTPVNGHGAGNAEHYRPYEGSVWRRIGAFFLNPPQPLRHRTAAGAGARFRRSCAAAQNFTIFAESTKLFLATDRPLRRQLAARGIPVRLDYFLYGPLFNILRTSPPTCPHGWGRSCERLQLHAAVRGDSPLPGSSPVRRSANRSSSPS